MEEANETVDNQISEGNFRNHQDTSIEKHNSQYLPVSRHEDDNDSICTLEDPDLEIVNYFDELDNEERQAKEMTRQFQELLAEKEKMKESFNELLEEQKNLLKYSSQELAPALKERTQNLSLITKMNEELKAENEALKIEVSETTAKFGQQKQLEDENATLKEKFGDLETELSKLKVENEMLKQKMSVVESEVCQQKEENQREKEDLELELSETRSKLSLQEAKVEELGTTIKYLADQHEEALKQKLTELESALTEKVNLLETDKRNLMSRIEELTINQQEEHEKYLVCQMDLENATAGGINKQRDEEIKKLESVIDELHGCLKRTQNELNQERGKTTNAENEYTNLKNQLEFMREKAENDWISGMKIKELEEVAQKLQLGLADAESRIKRGEVCVRTLEKQIWCGLKVDAYRTEMKKDTGVSNKEAVRASLNAVLIEHQGLIEEADNLLKQGRPDSIDEPNECHILQLLQEIGRERFARDYNVQEEPEDPEVFEDAQEGPSSRDNNHPVPVPRKQNASLETPQVSRGGNNLSADQEAILLQQQLLEDVDRHHLPQQEEMILCPMCFLLFNESDLNQHVDNCYPIGDDNYEY